MSGAVAYLDDYYAREADRIARGPQFYGGSAEVAALRCFKRYHPLATTETVDAGGVLRWITQKQSRILAVLMRDAGKPGLKMRLIADETRTCPSTVSRTLLKFQAWGLFAVDIRRGRNGGISVFRAIGDRFADYALRARIKIRALKAKALNVASSNKTKVSEYVPSWGMGTLELPRGTVDALKLAYEEGKNSLRKVLTTLDATFSAMEAELASTPATRRFVSATLDEIERLKGEPDL